MQSQGSGEKYRREKDQSRTGVPGLFFPRGKAKKFSPVFCLIGNSLNGKNGEMTATWLTESGFLEHPIQ